MPGQANPLWRYELREEETLGPQALGDFADPMPSRKASLLEILVTVPQTDTGGQG